MIHDSTYGSHIYNTAYFLPAYYLVLALLEFIQQL